METVLFSGPCCQWAPRHAKPKSIDRTVKTKKNPNETKSCQFWGLWGGCYTRSQLSTVDSPVSPSSSQLCVNANSAHRHHSRRAAAGYVTVKAYRRKEAEFQNVQGLIKSTKMKFLFAFTLAASLAALVIAAPLDLSATGAQGDDMAELAALSALLSP